MKMPPSLEKLLMAVVVIVGFCLIVYIGSRGVT